MLYKNLLASTALFAAGIDAVSYSTPTRAKRQAPEGMVTVQTVKVGDMDGNLKFSPEALQADPGSMLQFQFYPKNHSVAQSTFENPCQPISMAKPEKPGINSGFMPMTEDATDMPVWTVMVNDTNPMWLYCGQPGHCEKGMVMSINVPQGGNRTLDQFKSNAAAFNREAGGTGTGRNGSLPTATSGSGNAGQQPNPSGSASNTASPAEETFNIASKPSGNAAGYMALLVAGYAILGL